jgi:predicted DsbA family dithiol-disulfide isomerase
MTTRIDVYYDYLCPYACRLFMLLQNIRDGVDGGLEIGWKAFSIEQQNNEKGPDFNLWDHPEHPCLGIPALTAAKAAQNQGEDLFLKFHCAVFKARHEQFKNISSPQVLMDIARNAGLDMDRFAQDLLKTETRQAVGQDHLYGKNRHNLFGVPTLTVFDKGPVYIKINSIPDSIEEQLSLFELITQIAAKRPYLTEIKRPDPILL